MRSTAKMVDRSSQPHIILTNEQLVSIFLNKALANVQDKNGLCSSSDQQTPVRIQLQKKGQPLPPLGVPLSLAITAQDGHTACPATVPNFMDSDLVEGSKENQQQQQVEGYRIPKKLSSSLSPGFKSPAPANELLIPISSSITTSAPSPSHDAGLVNGYRIPKKLNLPGIKKPKSVKPEPAVDALPSNHLPDQKHHPELPVMYPVSGPAGLRNEVQGTVVHVCSLDEFYVTSNSERESLKQLSDQLNEAYKFVHRRGNALSFFVTSNNTSIKSVTSYAAQLIGSFWVCTFEDKNWYRARIIDLQDNNNILILYIDYGNMATLSADRLFPLKREFTDLPAMAHKCRMAGLKPLPGHQDWQAEQNEYFENCCHCMDDSCLRISVLRSLSSDSNDPWQVIHEVVVSHEEDETGNTINQQLVDNGMAASNEFVRDQQRQPLAASSVLPFKPQTRNPIPAGLESEQDLDELFADDLDRFESARTAEEAMLGFVPQFEEKTCKFYPLGTCRRGALCDFKHVMPKANLYTATDEIPLQVIPGPELDLQEQYIVKITSFGDRFIYTSFPAGVLPYKKMSQMQINYLIEGRETGTVMFQRMACDMREAYKNVPDEKKDLLPSIGSLVAVRMPPGFIRGQVLEVMDDDAKFKILCIDTGVQYYFKRRDIFALKMQFTLYPAMARMLHVDDTNVIRGLDSESLNRTYYLIQVTGLPESCDDVPYVRIVQMAGQRQGEWLL